MKSIAHNISVTLNRRLCGTTMTALVILAGVTGFPVLSNAQQTPAFSGPGWALDDDFQALARYEFGQDRSALARVEYTVNQVSAGVSGAVDQQTLTDRLCAVLKGNATLDARRFVCRMLKQLGDPRAVPALEISLKDSEIALTALWALENTSGTEADDALIRALATVQDRVRLGVINALARRRTQAAVPALAGLLGYSETGTMQLAALALADIATPQALEALAAAAREALAETGQKTDRATMEGSRFAVLEPALVRAVAVVPPEQFDAWIELLPDDRVSPATRCARLSLLIHRYPERAVDLLDAALRSEEDMLVQAALGMVRARPDDAVTQMLTRVARKTDLSRHPEFIAALADRGAPEAREMAVVLVDSGNPEAAVEAFRTLEKTAVLEDLPMMVRQAGGAGPVAQAAFDAVTRLTLDGVDDRLASLASGKDTEVGVTALKLMGERRPVAMSPTVVRIARRADPPVAREALRTLQAMARPEDLPELIDLLKRNAEGELREETVRAIVAVCERMPEPARRSEALIEALEREGQSAQPYALALIDTLSRVGQPEGLTWLQNALSKSTGTRKQAVLDALASWPNRLALDLLRALVVGGAYRDAERDKLLRGYVRLLRAETAEASASLVARYRELFEQVAASDQERAMLLSGLAQVADLGTLDLIEEQFENASIFNEAANAFVRAAKPLFPADPEGVGKRLKALAERNIPDNVRNQIGEILAIAENFQGYICAWQASGPYEVAGKSADDLFDLPFPPEMEGIEAVWWVVPMAQENSRPWAVLLDRILGGADRVAYLRTYVWSPAAMDCVLLLGTNDGCKVWINGQLIHQFRGGRAFEPDQDRVPPSLREGWNSLLIAVYQYGGAWAASARITAPDGQPVPGLRFSIRPE